MSRRDRGNVIPGVAIATALMPPLCTAGFGLANGEWSYFFGAIYLFSLNAIFIATATVVIVRYLHFPFVEYLDEAAMRRVRVRITTFVLIVLIPAAWVMVGVVQEGLFARRAADFVRMNLQSIPGVGVVSQRAVGVGDATVARAVTVDRAIGVTIDAVAVRGTRRARVSAVDRGRRSARDGRRPERIEQRTRAEGWPDANAGRRRVLALEVTPKVLRNRVRIL